MRALDALAVDGAIAGDVAVLLRRLYIEILIDPDHRGEDPADVMVRIFEDLEIEL